VGPAGADVGQVFGQAFRIITHVFELKQHIRHADDGVERRA
jgi:hypothetical protein